MFYTLSINKKKNKESEFIMFTQNLTETAVILLIGSLVSWFAGYTLVYAQYMKNLKNSHRVLVDMFFGGLMSWLIPLATIAVYKLGNPAIALLTPGLFIVVMTITATVKYLRVTHSPIPGMIGQYLIELIKL